MPSDGLSPGGRNSNMIPPSIGGRSIFSKFARLALDLNLDPDAILARSRVRSQLYRDNSDSVMPLTDIIELFEIAGEEFGVEDFGLCFGETYGLPDLGPLMRMLRQEPSVGSALRTLAMFFHRRSEGLYLHFDVNDPPTLKFDIIAGVPYHCRQTIEAGVASITNIVRWLCGPNWRPESICFTYAMPANRQRYEKFFGCPIDFMHFFNGIVLNHDDCRRSLSPVSADEQARIERDDLNADLFHPAFFVHFVKQIIARNLPYRGPSANLLAAELRIDRRTLNRRLETFGLNYSVVLEQVRKDMAVQLLLGSNRPLTEIAGLIGFESLSALSRWFHLSFGSAPGRWRKHHKHHKHRAAAGAGTKPAYDIPRSFRQGSPIQLTA